MSTLTLEYLKSILRYDENTGWFIRLVNRKGGGKAGTRAGFVNRKVHKGRTPRNYRQLMIDRVRYSEHILVWFYMKGHWPDHEIDHENCDGTDNRWSNLRAATRSQNACNRTNSPNNKSGYKGVCYASRERKWLATITIRRKRIYLGHFETPEDAYAAYCRAADKYHGEFKKVA